MAAPETRGEDPEVTDPEEAPEVKEGVDLSTLTVRQLKGILDEDERDYNKNDSKETLIKLIEGG